MPTCRQLTRWTCSLGLGLFLLLGVLGPLACQNSVPAPTPDGNTPGEFAERPRLAVLLFFDQMRGDYLSRWKDLFGEGGLRRLQEEGAWFSNCHLAYAGTSTAPGHASVLTGCPPARHGIIENDWYDRAAGRKIYCVGSDRYDPVPPDRENRRISGSPERMLAPTLGDVLKESTDGKARVLALSFKDRSAVLPGGHRADACYWFDDRAGIFYTSTCYRDRLHPWVEEFNNARTADRWFGRVWDRLRPELDYERYSGPDNMAGEGGGVGQGRAFPHPTTGGLPKPGRTYYQALYNSPFGNEMLLELAKKAIDAEQLGSHDVPDLLSISFSSNDSIGHGYGADSQEVLDMTLCSDLIVKELLDHLDAKVGKGRYLVILTADHGICPLPEVSRKQGKDAQRVSSSFMGRRAEEFLQGTFGDKDDAKPPRWIESVADFNIYLNQHLLRQRGLESAKVEKALADWLVQQPEVQTAYTRTQLLQGLPKNDVIGQRVFRSFHPERSGDVIAVTRPYNLLGTGGIGTNHGTPHPYDTHVPFLVYGPGVHKGVREAEISPQAGAAIFARALGIQPPSAAETPVPADLFETEAK